MQGLTTELFYTKIFMRTKKNNNNNNVLQHAWIYIQIVTKV